MKIFSLAAVLLLLLTNSVSAQDQQGTLLRLVAALDEPEFYCIDLVGHGASIELDNPLQAHTCKVRNAADQTFVIDGEQIKVVEYDRCLQVAGTSRVTLSGSAVLARECDNDNPLQKISLTESGLLQIGDTEYCIVAGVESTNASGPSHVWRSLSTAKCASANNDLGVWQLGLE